MSSLGSRAYFSMSRITDPTKHKAYSSWHGLDHQPENLALRGVALGRRWVCTPECAEYAISPSESLAPTQYMNIYWFSEPVAESIREWDALASLTRLWGRRPEVDPLNAQPSAFFATTLSEFCVPVKGYVAPSVTVPPDVLPFRPDRGVYLSISRFTGTNVDILDAMAWYDRVHLPDLTASPDVAGAWCFVSADTFDQDRNAPTMSFLRFTLLYLEESPVKFAARKPGLMEELRSRGRILDTSGVEEPQFAAPFQAILPWQWDWFEGESSPSV
jgi:hypothetical protein